MRLTEEEQRYLRDLADVMTGRNSPPRWLTTSDGIQSCKNGFVLGAAAHPTTFEKKTPKLRSTCSPAKSINT
jgi:hypothetical protein